MTFLVHSTMLGFARIRAAVIAASVAMVFILVAPAGARAQQSAPSSATPQSQTGSNGTASDKSAPSPSTNDDAGTTRLRIVVTNSQDKPVANASVYIRFGDPGKFFHKDRLAEMNFKTNGDGSVKVPDVPIGRVLIQIVAKGLHTYGKWYDITKDSDTIQIKLDPPPHWY